MQAKNADEGRIYRCFNGVGCPDILVIPVISENRWIKVGEYNYHEWLTSPLYIDIEM